MKLAISNMAWKHGQEEKAYQLMQKYGFKGLEIVPTKVIAENPYDKLEKIVAWKEKLQNQYGFEIVSMQSIWYGRKEKLFGNGKEREKLISYTYKAIDFAGKLKCGNLVLGSPRNRNMPYGCKEEEVLPFFELIADYADTRETVVSIEPNPPIYNTNFINTTQEAFALVDRINSSGFQVNLDFGTIIENQENIADFRRNIQRINHVHISEPMLKPIRQRKEHVELIHLLKQEGYRGYISIEMQETEDMELLENIMKYVADMVRE